MITIEYRGRKFQIAESEIMGPLADLAIQELVPEDAEHIQYATVQLSPANMRVGFLSYPDGTVEVESITALDLIPA